MMDSEDGFWRCFVDYRGGFCFVVEGRLAQEGSSGFQGLFHHSPDRGGFTPTRHNPENNDHESFGRSLLKRESFSPPSSTQGRYMNS